MARARTSQICETHRTRRPSLLWMRRSNATQASESLNRDELILDGEINQGAAARVDRLDYRPHPPVERGVIR